MVTDDNQTYCGDHFTMHTNIKSVCYKPDTNVLYVNYPLILFYFLKINLFYLFLFLAVFCLRCGAWASHCSGFSCCAAWALGTQASVVVACWLSSCGSQAVEHRFSSCGTRAQLLTVMWDLPGPGLEPMSPALAGRFLTTAPPGKCLSLNFKE